MAFWQMLRLSASLRGFFLMHYTGDFKNYMQKLVGLYKEGKVISTVDTGDRSAQGPFIGLERVNDAVEVGDSGPSEVGPMIGQRGQRRDGLC